VTKNLALSRREFLRMAGVTGAVVGLGGGLGGLLAACGGSSTTTTSAAPATTASTAASASTETTAAATGTLQTLKIGHAAWLGFFVGMDTDKCLKLRVKMINDAGGVKVGNDAYKLELVSYDTSNDQATAQAVANKLIFQDKVQLVVWTDFFWNAVLPTTEQNKIITCGADLTGTVLQPQYHYCFNTGVSNTSNAVLVGWFAKNYPDKKKVIMALTDDNVGKPSVDIFTPVFKTFGLDYSFEFYPANATDLSALGTKIKTANPDVMMAVGGTFQVYAAARQAGWNGIIYNPGPTTADTMIAGVGDESLVEGAMGGGNPLEYDPAKTEAAQAFKQAWIKEYGKWEAPEVSGVAHFDAIVTAIQKAGTLGTDKVADVIAGGLEFDSPYGHARMIPRSDLGNSRTVDSVTGQFIKKIVNGKAQVLEDVSIDDALAYWQKQLDFSAANK
jgi:branched-chain amino acid transport system substrate-binding protein